MQDVAFLDTAQRAAEGASRAAPRGARPTHEVPLSHTLLSGLVTKASRALWAAAWRAGVALVLPPPGLETPTGGAAVTATGEVEWPVVLEVAPAADGVADGAVSWSRVPAEMPLGALYAAAAGRGPTAAETDAGTTAAFASAAAAHDAVAFYVITPIGPVLAGVTAAGVVGVAGSDAESDWVPEGTASAETLPEADMADEPTLAEEPCMPAHPALTLGAALAGMALTSSSVTIRAVPLAGAEAVPVGATAAARGASSILMRAVETARARVPSPLPAAETVPTLVLAVERAASAISIDADRDSAAAETATAELASALAASAASGLLPTTAPWALAEALCARHTPAGAVLAEKIAYQTSADAAGQAALVAPLAAALGADANNAWADLADAVAAAAATAAGAGASPVDAALLGSTAADAALAVHAARHCAVVGETGLTAAQREMELLGAAAARVMSVHVIPAAVAARALRAEAADVRPPPAAPAAPSSALAGMAFVLRLSEYLHTAHEAAANAAAEMASSAVTAPRGVRTFALFRSTRMRSAPVPHSQAPLLDATDPARAAVCAVLLPLVAQAMHGLAPSATASATRSAAGARIATADGVAAAAGLASAAVAGALSSKLLSVWVLGDLPDAAVCLTATVDDSEFQSLRSFKTMQAAAADLQRRLTASDAGPARDVITQMVDLVEAPLLLKRAAAAAEQTVFFADRARSLAAGTTIAGAAGAAAAAVEEKAVLAAEAAAEAEAEAGAAEAGSDDNDDITAADVVSLSMAQKVAHLDAAGDIETVAAAARTAAVALANLFYFFSRLGLLMGNTAADLGDVMRTVRRLSGLAGRADFAFGGQLQDELVGGTRAGVAPPIWLRAAVDPSTEAAAPSALALVYSLTGGLFASVMTKHTAPAVAPALADLVLGPDAPPRPDAPPTEYAPTRAPFGLTLGLYVALLSDVLKFSHSAAAVLGDPAAAAAARANGLVSAIVLGLCPGPHRAPRGARGSQGPDVGVAARALGPCALPLRGTAAQGFAGAVEGLILAARRAGVPMPSLSPAAARAAGAFLSRAGPALFDASAPGFIPTTASNGGVGVRAMVAELTLAVGTLAPASLMEHVVAPATRRIVAARTGERPLLPRGVGFTLNATSAAAHGAAGASVDPLTSSATVCCAKGGIVNPACVCYMNSTLQLIGAVRPVRNAFVNWDGPQADDAEPADEPAAPSGPNQPTEAHIRFVETLRDFLLGAAAAGVAQSPEAIHEQWPQAHFDVAEQHDAYEAFQVLLDAIEKGFRGSAVPAALDAVFGIGQVARTAAAPGETRCSHAVVREDKQVALTVQLTDEMGQPTVARLEDGLDLTFAPMVYDEYRCRECNERRAMERRAALSVLPPVLVLHLGRIVPNPWTGRLTKLGHEIETPAELDVARWCAPGVADAQETRYRLVGAVVHAGVAEAGHYWYLGSRPDGTGARDWFELNDERVTPMVESDALAQIAGSGRICSGYLLQYERVDASCGDELVQTGLRAAGLEAVAEAEAPAALAAAALQAAPAVAPSSVPCARTQAVIMGHLSLPTARAPAVRAARERAEAVATLGAVADTSACMFLLDMMIHAAHLVVNERQAALTDVAPLSAKPDPAAAAALAAPGPAAELFVTLATAFLTIVADNESVCERKLRPAELSALAAAASAVPDPIWMLRPGAPLGTDYALYEGFSRLAPRSRPSPYASSAPAPVGRVPEGDALADAVYALPVVKCTAEAPECVRAVMMTLIGAGTRAMILRGLASGAPPSADELVIGLLPAAVLTRFGALCRQRAMSAMGVHLRRSITISAAENGPHGLCASPKAARTLLAAVEQTMKNMGM